MGEPGTGKSVLKQALASHDPKRMLAPEDVREFIFGQFDRVSLAHSAFSDEVLGLDEPVVVEEHYWTCPDTGESGNAIDFMMRFRGLSFAEAMDLLA